MTTHAPRGYQSENIDGIEQTWARGVKNVMSVLPTGGGKTFVIARTVERSRTVAICIAHRAELVAQMSTALAREGIRHRVIGPDHLRRSCIQAHIEEVGRSFYDPTSPYAVAGVDTLVRMDAKDPLFASVGLWVTDECFPAGTMIATPDGDVPIETIRVGDTVIAFDEFDDTLKPRKVTRLFCNPMPLLMTHVKVGRKTLDATPSHPFYTARGWVKARDLRLDDYVLDRDHDFVGVTQAEDVFGDCTKSVYNIEVEELHTYIAEGLVVHNCHHVVGGDGANKWGKAISMFPNAKGLGVTATPLRADGKGLGRHAHGVFDEMIVGPGMRDLINAGYLTDYKCYVPKSDLDLANVHISASGDYNPEELRAARRKSTLTGDVVKHYCKLAHGKLGVTFDTDITSAGDTCAAFRAAGVPAEVLSGKTPAAQRAEILRRFRARQVWQIISVDVISEGFDLPAIEVVSFARATMSFSLYAQQLGRALRLMVPPELMARWETLTPEQRRAHIAASGKPHAIVIDHVGNIMRHGPPDRPRIWSLDARERRSRSAADDAIPLRTCDNPECNQPYERVLPGCPWCGNEPVPADRSKPEYVDGDLALLDDRVLAAMRGEVARIDGEAVMPWGASEIVRLAVYNRHTERQRAQGALRDLMALWGGWQTSLGRGLSEAWRRFYYQFGISVMDAQALGSGDAATLAGRVRENLELNGIDVSVNNGHTGLV